MTYLTKPRLHHPTLARNRVGYTRRDYEGKVSTLCAGCGHDSITASVIEACYELAIEPHGQRNGGLGPACRVGHLRHGARGHGGLGGDRRAFTGNRPPIERSSFAGRHLTDSYSVDVIAS